MNRKRSILDAVREDADGAEEEAAQGRSARASTSISPAIRDLERAIAGLPPEYRRVEPPDFDGDMKDWPRIAKLQSDLLVQALATRQTRVASYMLTKCQGLSRFPWLGLHGGAASRLHARRRQGAGRGRSRRAAHSARHLPLARRGVRVPGGEAEVDSGRRRHAARPHLPGLRARARRSQSAQEQRPGDDRRRRHAGRLATGSHTRMTGTVGDLYLTLADEVLEAGLGKFPTATKKLSVVLA